MRYETFYSMHRRLQEVAEYVDGVLEGVSRDRIVSVTHSMALGDSGPEPVMFYSVLVVIRRNGDDRPLPAEARAGSAKSGPPDPPAHGYSLT